MPHNVSPRSMTMDGSDFSQTGVKRPVKKKHFEMIKMKGKIVKNEAERAYKEKVEKNRREWLKVLELEEKLLKSIEDAKDPTKRGKIKSEDVLAEEISFDTVEQCKLNPRKLI